MPIDFFLFPAEDAQKAAEWVVNLVSERIPEKFHMNPVQDIQVLTPMYRGAAGVEALNQELQKQLNPSGKGREEVSLFGRVYRTGDKVMQIRNNYDKDVFNGDIGIINSINHIDQTIIVAFDSYQKTLYDFSEVDEIVLAYAISVHKAQGSEFPAIVMPIITQHYVMLQRNLLYTAITRAKQLCVLTGNFKAISIAVKNNQVTQRLSRLANRIKDQ